MLKLVSLLLAGGVWHDAQGMSQGLHVELEHGKDLDLGKNTKSRAAISQRPFYVKISGKEILDINICLPFSRRPKVFCVGVFVVVFETVFHMQPQTDDLAQALPSVGV
jgi:hypothetical protein